MQQGCGAVAHDSLRPERGDRRLEVAAVLGSPLIQGRAGHVVKGRGLLRQCHDPMA
jgi:hypothetical protein